MIEDHVGRGQIERGLDWVDIDYTIHNVDVTGQNPVFKIAIDIIVPLSTYRVKLEDETIIEVIVDKTPSYGPFLTNA